MHNKLRRSSGNSGDQMKSNDVNDFKYSTFFKNKTNAFRFGSVINEKRAVQNGFFFVFPRLIGGKRHVATHQPIPCACEKH